MHAKKEATAGLGRLGHAFHAAGGCPMHTTRAMIWHDMGPTDPGVGGRTTPRETREWCRRA